jgi:hypothetical protein
MYMCVPFCTGVVYVVAWFNVDVDAHNEKKNVELYLHVYTYLHGMLLN